MTKRRRPLTKQDLQYDSFLGQLIWTRDGNRIKEGDIAGSVNKDGYRNIYINNRPIPAHRIIWELHHGAIPKRMQIDHENHQTDCNYIWNLRLTTVAQNQWNQKVSAGSTSGIKGVNWNERLGRWISTVTKNGKQHTKSSKTKQEAILWVRAKREELHGKFANHG